MPSVPGVSQTVAVTLAFKQCVGQMYDGLHQLHTYTFNYKHFTLQKIILHDFQLTKISAKKHLKHTFPTSPLNSVPTSNTYN